MEYINLAAQTIFFIFGTLCIIIAQTDTTAVAKKLNDDVEAVVEEVVVDTTVADTTVYSYFNGKTRVKVIGREVAQEVANTMNTNLYNKVGGEIEHLVTPTTK